MTIVDQLLCDTPALLAGFDVRRIPGARVVWLNERYLASVGVCVRDPEQRRQLSAALLEDFGVISTANTAVRVETGGRGRLFADRYGGTGGSIHGGSGRAGSAGNYIAKGIGRTPLVSDDSDWWHSTGLMWLSEAVREAILSEVCTVELPHGAVPTVAIIDTGIEVQRQAGARVERCGVAIRPFFFRPAHFERSIYFGDSGTPASAQFLDAQRVQQMWECAGSQAGPVGQAYPGLTEMLALHASQIGYARALRLWPGRFLSSNASVDGRVADFGSVRAVPNWRRQAGQPGECFGSEAQQLHAAALSLSFYKERGRGDEAWRAGLRDLYQSLNRHMDTAFDEAVDRSFGVSAISTARDHDFVLESIRTFYDLQQQRAGRGCFEADASFALESVSSAPGVAASRLTKEEQDVALGIVRVLDLHRDARHMFEYVWRDNRRSLSSSHLEAATIPFVDRVLGRPPSEGAGFEAFIDGYVARAARLTRLVPPGYTVLNQRRSGRSWTLTVRESVSGRTCRLFLAHGQGGRVMLDGGPCSPDGPGITLLATCAASGLGTYLARP